MKLVLQQQFTPKIMFDKNKSFKVDPENPQEVNVNINFDISVSYKPNPNVPGEYLVEMLLAWHDPKSPILLDVLTCGVYTVHGDIQQDRLDKMLRVEGADGLFPFLRERVSSLTANAGLPPLMLPPIDFEYLYETNQQKPTLQ